MSDQRKEYRLEVIPVSAGQPRTDDGLGMRASGTWSAYATRDAALVSFEIPEANWASRLHIPLRYLPELIERLQDVEGMGEAYREGERARKNGAARSRNPYLGKSARGHAMRTYEWSKGWDGDGAPFFGIDRKFAAGHDLD